jgi:hypothetical protein
MPVVAAVPGPVRVAGALVCAQGLLGLVFVVALVWRVVGGTERAGNVLGEAGYFLVLSAAVLAVGAGLVLGRRWARTPAIVVQLLLLGVAWYTAGPSGRPEYGIPVAAVCLVTAGLLFSPAARTWSEDRSEP